MVNSFREQCSLSYMFMNSVSGRNSSNVGSSEHKHPRHSSLDYAKIPMPDLMRVVTKLKDKQLFSI